MTIWETQTATDVVALAHETVAGAGNRPIALDDSEICWFVEQGAVDVFLGEQHDGVAASPLMHVLRAEAGSLVFGTQFSQGPLFLVAKGLPESKLHRVEVAALALHARRDWFVQQVDAWVSEFAAAVARRIEPHPSPDIAVDASDDLEARAGQVVSARAGCVAWVAGDEPSAMLYLGTETTLPGRPQTIPLTSQSWITAREATGLKCQSTGDLVAAGGLLDAMVEFHRMVLSAEQLNRQLLLADEVNFQTAHVASRRRDEQGARRSLFAVLGTSHRGPAAEESGLVSALRIIGKRERIEFRVPAAKRGLDDEQVMLSDILDASAVRARRVHLVGVERWWSGDSGALLALRRSDAQPIALLPSMVGRYRSVDPLTGRRRRINARLAAEFEEDAWFFYRPLPTDSKVTGRHLVRFAGLSAALDLGRFAAIGWLISMLALVPAALLAYLADWSFPARDSGALAWVVAGHVVLGIAIALFSVLQAMAMIRLQGRTGSRLTAALWDRVLDLPVTFFRRYTAGDLGVRMSSISVLQGQASSVATSLLGAVALLSVVPLLLAYSAPLAWTSLSFGIASLVVIAFVGYLQVTPLRQRQDAVRRLSGGLLQFINGIGKLRTAGAERSAFASWARSSRDVHSASLKVQRLDEHLVGYSTATPALAGAVLFGVALWQGPENLAVGDFVAVYIASMTIYGTVSALGSSFKTAMAMVPIYEQVAPLLEAVPEKSKLGAPLPKLQGEIVLDNVSFRYSETGTDVVDDCSLRASPGEFVAVVGESGAGKTTLMRLALGLEHPTTGGVYYDGMDLESLDRRVLRQVGVVSQDGPLLPGNILDNIIGLSGELSLDDAWNAAEMAAVANDIADMPMGMFTIVGDNSMTFSGGQIQRMRIAAALARRPKILFFDEATSFLDANSQAQVMEAVSDLAITRIVIAHRLSTIRHADHIYVIQAGRVAQAGTFDELSSSRGPFRDLVQRQVA